MSNIIPEAAIFYPTGTFETQYHRSIDPNVTAGHIDALDAKTHGGKDVSSTTVSGISGDILKPKVAVRREHAIAIPNGWGEPRYRFFMSFRVRMPSGIDNIEIITGFTDYIGVSHNGKGDPDMRLFINNMITLRPDTYTTNRGVTHTRMVEVANSQVLTPAFHDSVYSTQGVNQHPFNIHTTTPELTTIRPQDVFSAMSTTHGDFDALETFDTRTKLSNNMICYSDRRNGAPSQYISRFLSSHRKALMDTATSGNYEHTANVAMGMVDDGVPYANQLIASWHLTYGDLIRNGSMTYGQLCNALPGFDEHIAEFYQPPRVTRGRTMHVAGEADGWGDASDETLIAVMLANSVPAIMVDTLLSGTSFHAHNMTLTGFPDFTYSVEEGMPAKTFTKGLAMEPRMEVFRNRILHEIFPDISQQGRRQIGFSMQVDLMGETSIQISVDGRPSVPYTIPSFCDSRLSPMVSLDYNTLMDMGNQLDTLSSNINKDCVEF